MLFDEKLEILRKKLKFEHKIKYDCIMKIVDNMKKAKERCYEQLKTCSYFSTAFLFELKKEIVEAIVKYQKEKHLESLNFDQK